MRANNDTIISQTLPCTCTTYKHEALFDPLSISDRPNDAKVSSPSQPCLYSCLGLITSSLRIHLETAFERPSGGPAPKPRGPEFTQSIRPSGFVCLFVHSSLVETKSWAPHRQSPRVLPSGIGSLQEPTETWRNAKRPWNIESPNNRLEEQQINSLPPLAVKIKWVIFVFKTTSFSFEIVFTQPSRYKADAAIKSLETFTKSRLSLNIDVRIKGSNSNPPKARA